MRIRASTCAVALAAGLLATAASAQVVDFGKYPDLKGQWDRTGPPNNWRQLAGPPPLTPEYQKVFDQSVAEQRAGKPGNWPSTFCMPEGMPAMMNLYNPMEIIVTPETTYILMSHNNDVYRRIYTDGRDWPEDAERTLVGYSIGKWIDETGDGKYTALEVETRFLRGPRAYEASGLPFHEDNQTIIKERFYLDKADRNTLYDEITVIDHAMTRPYIKVQKAVRKPDPQPIWRLEDCPARQRLDQDRRRGLCHQRRRRQADAGLQESAPAGFELFRSAAEVTQVQARLMAVFAQRKQSGAVAIATDNGITMNALRCAAALLVAAPLVATLPDAAGAEVSTVDRDTCINSDNTATADAAMAACTRLVEALARGELAAPEGAAVHMARGNLYAVQRDLERAIADYDRAIALDADRSLAFFNRAGAFVASGQNDRALADYGRAIELDPTDADAYVGRARVLYQKKDFVAALADYNAALRLAPDDVETLAERGDVHERSGMYDRAADDYSRLIAIEPRNAKAWNNRCWDRAVLGRLDEALADCNESLRLAPGDSGTLDSRGFIYLKLGRFAEAIADYDAALAGSPRQPSSLYGRGQARLRSQQDAEAGRADLAAAKVLDPDVAAEFARYGLGE